MSRSHLRTGFTLLLTVAACTRTPAVKLLNEEPPAVRTNTLTLPPFKDPADPRLAWIEDLIQPRLSRISALVWGCNEDLSAFDIDLAGIGASCPEFLRVNFPTRFKGAVCRSDTLVRVYSRDRKCDPNARPAILARLRLPPGAGLYQRDSAETLKPRFENLPPIQFPASGARRMVTPDERTWLSAAGPRGAVILSLQPRPPGVWSEAALGAWLSTLKNAAFFHPSLELGIALPAPSPGPTPKLPWIRVANNYREPLLRDACEYIERWISARELLAADKDIDPTREVVADCALSWVDDPLPPGSVVLAHLPLPLTMEDSTYFPFKTIEDALSPSLFQSLKIAR